MLHSIVIALHRSGDPLVLRKMAGGSIPELVAIAVITHISVHICVIVAHIDRFRMPVMGREMTPVPGRPPGCITRSHQIGIYCRYGDIHGLDDIFRAIDIGRTYNLYTSIGIDCSHLRDKGGDVLIHIIGKHCLNDKDVGISFHRFYNPQIIHITVAVQVQVRQHIGRIIEQILKFLYG